MNTKVLVVGLGGVGSEIVSSVAKIAEDQDVRFVVMDTDINTIGRIRREGFSGKIIQLSDSMTVGEYLAGNPEAQQRWFLGDEILKAKPMTEGAGQVREVSRLAFELASRKGKLKPLEEALEELFQMGNEGAAGALRILIVSSLAGGTGSGCILPVALHLRELVASRFSRRDIIIRGIFLTADCFYSILGSDYEKRSLAGNSYAAIKELDAFMKKADGYLPRFYQGIYLDSKSRNALSYNYCYLFSAQDAQTYGMASFQALKNYIVECIYAQILSPMQALNNSIEDNVLKSTMAGGIGPAEFKRYCAAGIQAVRYPYEDILEYLALSKSVGVLSDEWMVLDAAYEEEKRKQREVMKEGGYAELAEMQAFAIQYIRSADPTNRMATLVHQELQVEIDGVRKDAWTAYVEELQSYAEELAGRVLAECKEKSAVMAQDLNMLGNKRKRTRTAVMRMMEHYDELFRDCENAMDRMTGVSIRQCFHVQRGQKLEPYHFEYWLQGKDGFIHLIALRCFLYFVLEEIDKKLKSLHGDVESSYENIRHIRTKTFLRNDVKSDPFRGNEIAVRQMEMLDDLKQISELWFLNGFGKVQHIANEYKDGVDRLMQHYRDVIYERLLQAGQDYLSKISEGLDEFFKEFYYNRSVYQNRMKGIRAKFDKTRGSAVQYICTDERYLADLLDRVRDVNKDRETNKKLSRHIYQIIKGDLNDVRKKGDVSELYQKEIPEYWKDNLKKQYENILDVNIVEAILQEGAFQEGEQQQYDYLDKLLEQAWKKTVPRLLVGSGEQGQYRLFCLYHRSLLQLKGLEEDIINRRLVQSGGTASDRESDRYEIIFYKVIYNLSACDIEDFAVGKPEIDSPRGSGASFRAYHEIVKREKKTRLPLHIDRNWSNIFKMPDINSVYTTIRMKMVYQMAFLFWQKGQLREENRDGKVYYSCVTEDGEISISGYEDGKTLKQIIDDLADFYGGLEEKWQVKQEELAAEQAKGVQLEKSDFWRDVQDRESVGKSVFELPYKLLYQEPERFWDADVVTCVMESILDLLWDRLTWFCGEQEAKERYRELINAHMDLQERNAGVTGGNLDPDEQKRRERAWGGCYDEISRYLQRKRWYDIDREVRYKKGLRVRDE